MWDFISDPKNLPLWWPRVVAVEFVEGAPGTPTAMWTKILRAESGRRMRLDYTCTEAEPGVGLTWVHELEGTRFSDHLNRQATTITLSREGGGCKVAITSEGELKGAAKLASFALKTDQKKMLDQALEALAEALKGPGDSA